MRKMTWIVTVFAAALLCSCNSPSSPENSNAPSDHTVSQGGVRHKSGLTNPLANCVSCHGSDLRGGTSGTSCFKCHGQTW